MRRSSSSVAVPAVLTLGALTTIYWAQWLPLDRAMLMGVAVLVVACPCAVGLAAPLATSLGIGRLARARPIPHLGRTAEQWISVKRDGWRFASGLIHAILGKWRRVGRL